MYLILRSAQQTTIFLLVNAKTYTADLESVTDRSGFGGNFLRMTALGNRGVILNGQDSVRNIVDKTNLKVREGGHNVASDRNGIKQSAAVDVGFFVALGRPDGLPVFVEDRVQRGFFSAPLLIQ